MRKHTLATRNRIIDTAEILFAERGVDNTSLLDIAKATQQENRSHTTRRNSCRRSSRRICRLNFINHYQERALNGSVEMYALNTG
ncbi:MAG: TetR family transcriptional regulator [Pseudomonadales bacterium]